MIGLDNPVYAALSGAHARFAQVSGRVLRYDPEVAPFMGLPSDPSPEDWRDAIELVPPGTYAGLLRAGEPLPASWASVRDYEVVQMVGERVTGAEDPEAVSLGPADVPEMLELVRETQPGPFLDRTIELGDYLGLRRGGELVAMAGERLRFDGWTEISAVCTAPADRGHGLAKRLMGALIAGIERRSDQAFLHVLADNTSAVGLYESLGFDIRRRWTISVVTPV